MSHNVPVVPLTAAYSVECLLGLDIEFIRTAIREHGCLGASPLGVPIFNQDHAIVLRSIVRFLCEGRLWAYAMEYSAQRGASELC